MSRTVIKSFFNPLCVAVVLSVKPINPFILNCSNIAHCSRNHWNKDVWEERQYQPIGMRLWPAAGSWVRTVPSWRLDWWRWNGHTAALSPGSGLVFLRWHRNSWFFWGEQYTAFSLYNFIYCSTSQTSFTRKMTQIVWEEILPFDVLLQKCMKLKMSYILPLGYLWIQLYPK